jgi:L-aspartate oxidase
VLRDAMTRLVGLERNATGMREALATIEQVERAGGNEPALLNMTAAAKLVTAAALTRQESRGGHYRTDYPATSEPGKRTFLTLDDANRIAASSATPKAAASL